MSQPSVDPRTLENHPSLDPRTPVAVGVGQLDLSKGWVGYKVYEVC